MYVIPYQFHDFIVLILKSLIDVLTRQKLKCAKISFFYEFGQHKTNHDEM